MINSKVINISKETQRMIDAALHLSKWLNDSKYREIIQKKISESNTIDTRFGKSNSIEIPKEIQIFENIEWNPVPSSLSFSNVPRIQNSRSYNSRVNAYCNFRKGGSKRGSRNSGNKLHKELERFVRYWEIAPGCSNKTLIIDIVANKMYKEHDICLINAEKSLGSKSLNLNGTYDCIGYIYKGPRKGFIIVVDFKLSKKEFYYCMIPKGKNKKGSTPVDETLAEIIDSSGSVLDTEDLKRPPLDLVPDYLEGENWEREYKKALREEKDAIKNGVGLKYSISDLVFTPYRMAAFQVILEMMVLKDKMGDTNVCGAIVAIHRIGRKNHVHVEYINRALYKAFEDFYKSNVNNIEVIITGQKNKVNKDKERKRKRKRK